MPDIAITILYSVQVPALLDASMDMAGGKINIHVLMALAAFASAFMGNALEGALLLAMFALSHVGEDPQSSLSNQRGSRTNPILNRRFVFLMQPRSTLLKRPWEM